MAEQITLRGEVHKWQKNQSMGFVEVGIDDPSVRAQIGVQGINAVQLNLPVEMARKIGPESTVVVTITVEG